VSTDNPGKDTEVEADDHELPPFDFNFLVLSLNASALSYLGETMGGPESGAPVSPDNLGLARQTIDMLAVIEEKTRGNLTGAEERLLHQVLFDLRMRFARKSGR
jgi:hypothetical protein